MARNTKEEALETRARILDTAEQIFSEKGVSRAALSDIAEAAGVTRGAIYWHFKNKVDLFDAMMQRVKLPMEQMTQRFSDKELEDPIAYIKASALNVILRLAKDEQTRRVFDIMSNKCEYVDEMEALRIRHYESCMKCVGHVEEGFKNAIKKGQLPAYVNTRRAARGMHALIEGMMSNSLLDRHFISLTKDAEPIIEIYLAGLAHQKPPA